MGLRLLAADQKHEEQFIRATNLFVNARNRAEQRSLLASLSKVAADDASTQHRIRRFETVAHSHQGRLVSLKEESKHGCRLTAPKIPELSSFTEQGLDHISALKLPNDSFAIRFYYEYVSNQYYIVLLPEDSGKQRIYVRVTSDIDKLITVFISKCEIDSIIKEGKLKELTFFDVSESAHISPFKLKVEVNQVIIEAKNLKLID